MRIFVSESGKRTGELGRGRRAAFCGRFSIGPRSASHNRESENAHVKTRPGGDSGRVFPVGVRDRGQERRLRKPGYERSLRFVAGGVVADRRRIEAKYTGTNSGRIPG
jgi:hypothetical protein